MIALVNEFEALLDTCVLAPMPLADTLLRLAEEPSIFVPRWSKGILDELHRVLAVKFGYTTVQADRRISVMRKHFEEAEVVGYEDLIPSMTNQEKDRHVLAAAVRAGAHCIVTYNLRDFPPESVRPYEIEVLSPDEFLNNQYHLNSALIMEKIVAQGKLYPSGLNGLLPRLDIAAPTFTKLLYAEAAA